MTRTHAILADATSALPYCAALRVSSRAMRVVGKGGGLIPQHP